MRNNKLFQVFISMQLMPSSKFTLNRSVIGLLISPLVKYESQNRSSRTGLELREYECSFVVDSSWRVLEESEARTGLSRLIDGVQYKRLRLFVDITRSMGRECITLYHRYSSCHLSSYFTHIDIANDSLKFPYIA